MQTLLFTDTCLISVKSSINVFISVILPSLLLYMLKTCCNLGFRHSQLKGFTLVSTRFHISHAFRKPEIINYFQGSLFKM